MRMRYFAHAKRSPAGGRSPTQPKAGGSAPSYAGSERARPTGERTGTRCAAGQPTMVSESHSRRSLASGGRHRTVTRGSDAAPATARAGPGAASATGPSEGAGTNLTPRLQIACSMIAVDHLRGQKLLAAVEGHCGRRALLHRGAARQGVRQWLPCQFGQYAPLAIAAGSRSHDNLILWCAARGRCRARPRPAGLGR